MIPLPFAIPGLWKWAGVGLLLLAVGGWGTYQKIRADVAGGQVAACKGRLAEFEGAYNALAAAVQQQAAAVADLEERARQAGQNRARAEQAARALKEQYQGEIARLRASQAAAGASDDCAAAIADIKREILR